MTDETPDIDTEDAAAEEPAAALPNDAVESAEEVVPAGSEEPAETAEADASDDAPDLDVDPADTPAADDETPVVRSIRPQTLDTVLTVSVWVLVSAVVLVAALFGFELWTNLRDEGTAAPTMRSVKALRDQVRANPNDSVLRVRYGEALGAAGKYDEAIEQLEQALILEPEHDGAYRALAIIAATREQWEAAKGYFLKVVELTESSEFSAVNARREEALFALGQIAVQENQYEEAIAYLKQALRIRRDASDSYYYLALAYQGLGEDDAALKQLEYGLTFDPNFAQAHFLAGEIYLAREDLVNASYFLSRAAEIAPDADPPAEALASIGTSEEWLARAKASLESGDPKTAVDEVLIARNLDRDNDEAAVMHVRILVALKNPAEALTVLNEVRSVVTTDSPLRPELDDLGAQLKAMGK